MPGTSETTSLPYFAYLKSRTILGELILILHASLRNHRLWITADVSCCLTCQELAGVGVLKEGKPA